MLSANDLHKNLEILADRKWCEFKVSRDFALKLKDSALKRHSQSRPATTGLSSELTPDLRNDRIFWLDRHQSELNETENIALNELDILRKEIKEFLRISLDEFECHFSYYAPGGKYVRHRDSTKLNNKRLVSFVIYLNENWSPEDGGQIAGYDEQNNQLFRIEPLLGNMIVFLSDLEHEVLTSKKDRLALTGWMRRK